MSFAPQNQAPDITDAIDGSITSWYDRINDCLKTSECVPGHYEYAQAPSYGNQCPIQEGGSTKIDVGCNRFEIVDLNNSYIDCEFTAPILIPAQYDSSDAEQSCPNDEGNDYYVGFKTAFDVIDQYRIYSNGDLIYTQNHACYESFLNHISLTDSAKEKSPCFATSDKIKRKDQNVPGIYIRTNNAVDLQLNVTIKMKIPLNMFPVLQNLKYFPSFMGKLSIEIYPSYKNIVWSNVTDIETNRGLEYFDDCYCKSISQFTGTYSAINSAAGMNNNANVQLNPNYIRGGSTFIQINTIADNVFVKHTTGGGNVSYTNELQAFSCVASTLNKFHLYQAVYMIKMDVYNSLEMNYLQIPLLFPIQTISNTKFTYPMNTSQHFTLQNTATLSHCDTIFVVFPGSSNERTVSYNPDIKAHLSINGKYYPRETLSTGRADPRFVNLIFDALNINNNPLMTPGEDIVSSINPYLSTLRVSAADNWMCDIYCFAAGDRSNFIYAVPLSTDEDFMGGISSNGATVQIELIGDRDALSDSLNAVNHTEAPVAIFLEDKLLKIYSMKPPGKPQIQITNATLDQIVASGGTA